MIFLDSVGIWNPYLAVKIRTAALNTNVDTAFSNSCPVRSGQVVPVNFQYPNNFFVVDLEMF